MWDLGEAIRQALEETFAYLSNQFSEITHMISMTPADAFGTDFWGTLLRMGSVVIMPFALVIMAYCLAGELYSVYCKSDGAVDMQVMSMTLVKFLIPLFLLTSTYQLLQAIFLLFNNVVQGINTQLTPSIAMSGVDIDTIMEKVNGMDFWGQLGYWMETKIFIWLGMQLINLAVVVIVYGRLFEIILYWIFAPIPFATLMHSEWSQVGKNFFKMFCALLLQGAMMLLCVAIYGILVKNTQIDASTEAAWKMLGYSAVLVFSLARTGNLAKRMLGTF